MSVIVRYIESKWSLIEAFSIADTKTIDDLQDGEREFEVCKEYAHFVKWDGEPPLITKLDDGEISYLKNEFLTFRKKNKEHYRSKCFLWVITKDSLIIAREKIFNPKRTHDSGFICHTNLTNNNLAYIGGELFFGADGYIYINNFSDRYGGPNTPPELWEATKKVFIELGYTNLFDLLELI
ncbi:MULTISPECIES: hypothetical protein [unclassified Arenibacter]|uniref:hypothetical protein n=1 Tax=unclassified Arenibacter TaxID=2615047 RepID=UPI000E347081|nr:MULTISPECIES: hypothetical protein [unclassified Arenibacter]MCM4162455.1 hypothetical protein [Arenibacter sp. A80]RFT58047.1 hypothetical protein D0S24_02485 [Arenibacter sp. P308M17]